MGAVALRALAILVMGGGACPGHAAILFDSGGFEAPDYAAGKLIGQQTWVSTAMTTNTAEVQSAFVHSGSQALRMGSEISPNEFYPPVRYIPSLGEIISVECDIARTVSATPSFGFFLEAYGTDGQRVARAGLGRDGTSIRAVRTLPTGTAPANLTVYAPMQWVHFEMQLDFSLHTWGLLIDGVPAGTSLPMTSVFAPGMSSADLQLVTFLASRDAGYFDNYRIRTLPAPGGAGAAAVVVLGGWMGRRRRRRGRRPCILGPVSGAGVAAYREYRSAGAGPGT